MSFREIKEAARQALHEFMGQPAVYYSDVLTGDPFAITARPHGKGGRIGDLPGTNLNYAEVYDRKERVILWREQVPSPVRQGLIIFSETEGYWIDTVEPPDGQTVTVNVNRATTEELLGLVTPGCL
mgnify:CR=1 FL=1|jgi:hypothetical protein